MVLITGANGQLGRCPHAVLPAKNCLFTDVRELDKSKIKKRFGVSIAHWTQGVEECLAKLS